MPHGAFFLSKGRRKLVWSAYTESFAALFTVFGCQRSWQKETENCNLTRRHAENIIEDDFFPKSWQNVYDLRWLRNPGRMKYNPGSAHNCPGVATPLVGGIAGGGSFEHKSDILSSKNFRKEAARVDAHEKEGTHDGMLRERREFKVDQSLRG